ncbi:hypothetical protein QTN25_002679 [Entamoeba marina]
MKPLFHSSFNQSHLIKIVSFFTPSLVLKFELINHKCTDILSKMEMNPWRGVICDIKSAKMLFSSFPSLKVLQIDSATALLLSQKYLKKIQSIHLTDRDVTLFRISQMYDIAVEVRSDGLIYDSVKRMYLNSITEIEMLAKCLEKYPKLCFIQLECDISSCPVDLINSLEEKGIKIVLRQDVTSNTLYGFNERIRNQFHDTIHVVMYTKDSTYDLVLLPQISTTTFRNYFEGIDEDEICFQLFGSTQINRNVLVHNTKSSKKAKADAVTFEVAEDWMKNKIKLLRRRHFKKKQPSKPIFVGDCVSSSKSIVMTKGQRHRAAVWKEISSKSFKVGFKIKVLGTFANGFAVVLQSDGPDAIGECGSGKGYHGIENGVAIEFSLGFSKESHDPNEHHVDILYQNDEAKMLVHNHMENGIDVNVDPPVYWDEKVHHIEVCMDEISICCWIDGTRAICSNKPIIFGDIWKNQRYIGITTGSFYDTNSLLITDLQVFGE